MSTSRAGRVLRGAGWVYGSQVITIAVQFAYAAVTSRSVDADGFGSYAIALTVVALLTLTATGGLGQSVARMHEIDAAGLRALAAVAGMIGIAAGTFLLSTASFWAWLWGDPSATASVLWLSSTAFIAPLSGVAAGLVRRLGQFRQLALGALSANILGMALGALAVLTWRTPESLLVSPICAQAVTLAVYVFIGRRLLLGRTSIALARPYLAFSWRVMASMLFAYLMGNGSKWAASRFFGASLLGYWNRAEVVTGVPFQQVQTALIQAIYPEFRHDSRGSARTQAVWSDLLGMVAWLAAPLAAVAAVVGPAITPILFGPGWEVAARLTAVFALIGGMQMIAMVLSSAVEAVAVFQLLWIGQAAQFLFVLAGVVTAAVTGDFIFLFVGIGAGFLGLHVAQIVGTTRMGLLSPIRLLRHYCGAVVAAAVCAGYAWIGVTVISGLARSPFAAAVFVASVPVLGFAIYVFRRRLPPLKIARSYGVL